MSEKLPVIDLGKIGLASNEEATQEDWQRVGKELAKAFESIGFVYLLNHGIPNSEISDIFSSSREFFDLSPEVKCRYKRGVTEIQGYSGISRERLTDYKDERELRESFDINNAEGMFPDEEVMSLRPAATRIIQHYVDLSKRLLTLMASALDLDPLYFLTKHVRLFDDDNSTSLRLISYPPIVEGNQNIIRCGQHTDYGTFTILFQDSMGGLQVLNRDGRWMDADPLPGALLVMIGDLAQFWTSDRFVATKHRVLVPEEEMKQKCPRQSVVCFVHPDNEVHITPLNASSKYQPITAKEHCENRFKATYQY